MKQNDKLINASCIIGGSCYGIELNLKKKYVSKKRIREYLKTINNQAKIVENIGYNRK